MIIKDVSDGLLVIAGRQTNMRPQSAPPRQALSELSSAMLPSDPAQIQRDLSSASQRVYTRPSIAKEEAGLGAAEAARQLALQSPASAPVQQALALFDAAEELYTVMGLYGQQSSGSSSRPQSAVGAVGGPSAQRQFADFEERVARLLKAPGAQNRAQPAAAPSAVWGRLQGQG